MLRLYEPQQGSIKIGGKRVSHYNPVWMRGQMGISKQDPAIMYKSLRDNVMYGSEESLKSLGDQVNNLLTPLNNLLSLKSLGDQVR